MANACREAAFPTRDTHILAGTQKRRPKQICCGNNDSYLRLRASLACMRMSFAVCLSGLSAGLRSFVLVCVRVVFVCIRFVLVCVRLCSFVFVLLYCVFVCVCVC